MIHVSTCAFLVTQIQRNLVAHAFSVDSTFIISLTVLALSGILLDIVGQHIHKGDDTSGLLALGLVLTIGLRSLRRVDGGLRGIGS